MEILERKDNVFSFDAKIIKRGEKYAVEVPFYIIEAMKFRLGEKWWKRKQVDMYIQIGSKNEEEYYYLNTKSNSTIVVPNNIRTESKNLSLYLEGVGIVGSAPYISEMFVKDGKILLRAYPTLYITLPDTDVVIECVPTDICGELERVEIFAVGERSKDMKTLLHVLKKRRNKIKAGIQLPEKILLLSDKNIYEVTIVGKKMKSRVLGPRYIREMGIEFVDTLLITISRYENEIITRILTSRAERELEVFREAVKLKERAEYYTEHEIRVLRQVFGHRNPVKPFLDTKKVLYVNGARGVGKTFHTMLAVYGLPTLYIIFDKEKEVARVRNPTMFYKKRDEYYMALINVYESRSLRELIEKLRILPIKTVVILDDIHYMYEYGYVELAQTLIKAVLNARNTIRILITDTPIEYYLLNLGLRHFAWEFVENSISIHIDNEVWNDDILKLMKMQNIEITLPRFLYLVKKARGATYRDIVKEIKNMQENPIHSSKIPE